MLGEGNIGPPPEGPEIMKGAPLSMTTKDDERVKTMVNSRLVCDDLWDATDRSDGPRASQTALPLREDRDRHWAAADRVCDWIQ